MGVNLLKRVVQPAYDRLKFFIQPWARPIVDSVEKCFEDAEKSTDPDPQVINNNEETNYIYNHFTRNLNQNNLTIVNNISFNYHAPQNRPPLRQPNYNLPTQVDTQTASQYPAGESIAVRAYATNQQFVYGKTKFNPLSTGKKGVKRNNPDRRIISQFSIAQRDAIRSLDKASNKRPIPIEHTGYLFASDKLNGLRGDGHIIYGLNSVSALAQGYRLLSSLAYLEPSNEIPVSYETVNVDDDVNNFQFSGEAEIVEPNIASQLGYDPREFANMTFEEVIKDFGQRIYALDNATIQRNANAKSAQDIKTCNPIGDTPIKNIQQFATYLISSIFFRSGFHRFPATMPESLLFDTEKYKKPSDQPNIFIDDALEYQEYLLKNLDAILGQFPISFKHKTLDNSGNTVEEIAQFPNLAEALTEIVGLLIGTAKDSDTAVALGVKNLVEVVKVGSLTLTAVDTARANADYLGYKFEDIEREIKIPFNPEGENLAEFLQESTMQTVSFDNVDKDTLEEKLSQLLTVAQITKSALGKRDNQKMGDAITEARRKEKVKFIDNWLQILDKYDGTSGSNINKPFPNAKVIDRSNPIK